MNCDSKDCFFNKQISQSQYNISCPICQKTYYCSIKCKEKEMPQHLKKCISYRDISQRCSSVNDTNDTISGLKSIRRRLEEFEVLNHNLGKGAYGLVKLVRDIKDSKQYAMKIMQKRYLLQTCTIDNLKKEIQIQRKLQHPHITKLHHYFEDSDNVYLILEYAENGTLFRYLRRRNKLPEHEAFIYFFQTCLGIDYLHKNNLIHRDIKPENLLINQDGNIKICDFGWSIDLKENFQQRYAFCGTFEYMAPEMIQKLPFDASLDIWCLGVLLYELIHGYTPFRANKNIEIINLIQQKNLNFDSTISQEVMNLIQSAIKQNPKERIKMEDIFKHPWFLIMSQKYNLEIDKYVYKITIPLPEQSSIKKPLDINLNSQKNIVQKETKQYDERQSQITRLSNTSVITTNRVSKISSRSDLQSNQLIQTPQNQQPIQDDSIMDKFFQVFGCVKRYK